MNWGCAILLLGLLAGIAAIVWLSRQPRVRHEPRHALGVLLCGIVLTSALIVLIEVLASRGDSSLDQCGLFLFGQAPAQAVLGVILFASHDRVTRTRFAWIVFSSFAASLLVPVAVISAWHTQAIEGPALFALALTSSLPSIPYIGFGLALPVVAFIVCDRIRTSRHTTAHRGKNL